jgi:succinyl-diaminopimelate desuccinylase
MSFESVSQKLDSLLPRIIEWQKGLSAIPALAPESGGQGEKEKMEYLRTIVQKLAPDETIDINAPDPRVECGYRPNLVALFKGKKQGGRVWVLSHVDVVPPGGLNLWDQDPYQVVVKGDVIIGRGVEDNQHGLVSSLAAVAAVKELGLEFPRDVGLVFVADEETNSKYGLRHVVKARRDLFSNDDLIIVPDAGNEDGTMIEVAEKSMLWMKVTVLGKQCHASMPEKGLNSLRAAAKMIVDLKAMEREFDRRDDMYDPPVSTFEPTKFEANVANVNTIPGKDVFYVDCRILPEYPVEDVKAAIERICSRAASEYGAKVEFEPVVEETAPAPTAADAPIVGAITRAVKDVYGRQAKPMGVGGGTVAAVFRKVGLPAAVWSTASDAAHQPNEFVPLASLVGDAKVFAHVMMNA